MEETVEVTNGQRGMDEMGRDCKPEQQGKLHYMYIQKDKTRKSVRAITTVGEINSWEKNLHVRSESIKWWVELYLIK